MPEAVSVLLIPICREFQVDRVFQPYVESV